MRKYAIVVIVCAVLAVASYTYYRGAHALNQTVPLERNSGVRSMPSQTEVRIADTEWDLYFETIPSVADVELIRDDLRRIYSRADLARRVVCGTNVELKIARPGLTVVACLSVSGVTLRRPDAVEAEIGPIVRIDGEEKLWISDTLVATYVGRSRWLRDNGELYQKLTVTIAALSNRTAIQSIPIHIHAQQPEPLTPDDAELLRIMISNMRLLPSSVLDCTMWSDSTLQVQNVPACEIVALDSGNNVHTLSLTFLNDQWGLAIVETGT